MCVRSCSLLLSLFLAIPGATLAESSESGRIGVYGGQFLGRPTASGEIYDGRTLTAAHASLPLGSFIRVANFETGKMLDVRVNDRKGADGTILTLSEAAARKIGLAPGKTTAGSLMVLKALPASPKRPGMPSVTPFQVFSRNEPPASRPAGQPPVQQVPAPSVPSTVPASAPQPAPVSAPAPAKKFQPFAGLGKYFEKKADPVYGAVENPNARVEPSSPSTTAAPIPNPGYRAYPATGAEVAVSPGGASGNGPLLPMSASSGASPSAIPSPGLPSVPSVPGAAGGYTPAIAPTASAAAPYRVQFGAFRRQANALELSGMLVRAGVGTTVVPSTATGLHLVLTSGGFPTAEAAQQWIDYEGARRGWRDRPMVIR